MKTITVCAGLIGALGLGAGTGAASAQESSLGRLFYTPEERQKLDLKRGVAIAPASSTPQTVIVNGMVARTGRAPILFIDGKETTGTGGGASQQQQLNQGIPLKTESGRTIAAKPGQIVDLANGRAMEPYQLVPGMADIAPKEATPPAITATAAAAATVTATTQSGSAKPGIDRTPQPKNR